MAKQQSLINLISMRRSFKIITEVYNILDVDTTIPEL